MKRTLKLWYNISDNKKAKKKPVKIWVKTRFKSFFSKTEPNIESKCFSCSLPNPELFYVGDIMIGISKIKKTCPDYNKMKLLLENIGNVAETYCKKFKDPIIIDDFIEITKLEIKHSVDDLLKISKGITNLVSLRYTDRYKIEELSYMFLMLNSLNPGYLFLIRHITEGMCAYKDKYGYKIKKYFTVFWNIEKL